MLRGFSITGLVWSGCSIICGRAAAIGVEAGGVGPATTAFGAASVTGDRGSFSTTGLGWVG